MASWPPFEPKIVSTVSAIAEGIINDTTIPAHKDGSSSLIDGINPRQALPFWIANEAKRIN
jgi:hypothetical protein